MKVNFQYSEFYIVIVVLVALLLALWQYFKFKKKYEASTIFVAILASLRVFVIVIIGLLFLVPFVKLIRSELEKPIIAIGIDNSSSIQLADSSEIRKVGSKLKLLQNELENDFDIEEFIFDDEVTLGTWKLDGKKSNLSSWLKFVSTRYKHSNLSAVVTISDGIFNAGGNPVYSGYQLAAPNFTVALGDTTIPRDARISYVDHNDIAYKGNQFPIKAGVVVEKMKDNVLLVQLHHQGKTVESKKIKIETDEYFHEFGFLVNADAVGIQQYTISIDQKEGELSLLNNVQKVFVEVIEADKNILIAYNSPHPDVAALRKSIERNKNYKVDLWWVNDPKPENRKTEFDKYHLVVLHNLPQGNPQKVRPVFESNASLMFVLDNSISFSDFNSMQNLARINVKSNEANEAYAIYNQAFVGYSLEQTSMNSIEEYPPLKALFGDISFSNQSDVILYQKIGSVTTGYPLLAVSQSDSKKIGIISATGIWRWFLYEYSINENYEGLDELFNQTVQYLSVKEDKRRLRLARNKFIFEENEDVKLSVSFYDKNYLPAMNADIKAEVIDANGKNFEFGFIPKGKIYEMDAGQLEPGDYSYAIKAALGDDLHNLHGKFTVTEVNVEFMQPIANHNLLFQLASQSNGEMFYPNQMNNLVEKLKNADFAKPIRHERAEISELIHNKWFFVLLLLMLTIEWVLRKYKGAY